MHSAGGEGIIMNAHGSPHRSSLHFFTSRSLMKPRKQTNNYKWNYTINDRKFYDIDIHSPLSMTNIESCLFPYYYKHVFFHHDGLDEKCWFVIPYLHRE